MMLKKTILLLSLLITSALNCMQLLENTDNPMELIIAAGLPNTERVQTLLNHNVNPNQKCSNNFPLLSAALNDQNENAHLLLQAQANPDLQNGYCQTALIIAATRGNNEIIQLLLQAGANPDLRDFDGRTALILATEGDRIETVRLLLQNQADNNIRDIYGDTALIYAKKYKAKNSSRLLDNWPFYQQAMKQSLFMATHPRCGAESPAKMVYPDIVEMIMSHAYKYHTTEQINEIAEQEKALQKSRFLRRNLYWIALAAVAATAAGITAFRLKNS